MGNLCSGVLLPMASRVSSLETTSCWDAQGEIQLPTHFAVSACAVGHPFALTPKAP